MTTITIDRALLEQAMNALLLPCDRWNKQQFKIVTAAAEAIRAELAKPVDLSAEMSAVADQYAHKLALDLECVLADYSGTWYDAAISTLGAYRKAMSAIHERESPTFMGEPVLSSKELANHKKLQVRQSKTTATATDQTGPVGMGSI